MSYHYVIETECRICGGLLKDVFDLGTLYVSDFIKPEETGEKAPLTLSECTECKLVQLKHSIDLDAMYRKYWYRSGLNSSMCRDLEDIVRCVEEIYGELEDLDVVVDIGCNDGTMFDFYTNENLVKVGYDPANNLAESALNHCNFFFNDYFTAQEYTFDKAKIVASIAMFYDLPNPNTFVTDVREVLDDGGVWVMQLMDLYSMLKINAVDNIGGEHFEYYKLSDIVNLMEKHDMRVFDCEYNKVNGGSLRVYVCHKEAHYEKTTRFIAFVEEENSYFASGNQMELLRLRFSNIKEKVCSFIELFNNDGKNIYGLAASTKANTLLQVLDLSNKEIKGIGEINKDKFGMITPGSRIPIIPEKEMLASKPDLIICLAWHFVETFDKVTEKFVEDGGYVLYPLPVPYVKHKKGNFFL